VPTSKGKGKGKEDGKGEGREEGRNGGRGDGVREGDPQSLFYKSDTAHFHVNFSSSFTPS